MFCSIDRYEVPQNTQNLCILDMSQYVCTTLYILLAKVKVPLVYLQSLPPVEQTQYTHISKANSDSHIENYYRIFVSLCSNRPTSPKKFALTGVSFQESDCQPERKMARRIYESGLQDRRLHTAANN